MVSRLVAAVLMCGMWAGSARADDRDQDARRLFQDGREAFERHEYQTAYDSFRQSYLLSQRPEMLFNMSSALKELDRPHDAADELRAYLRLVPTAPDRGEIEQRILTLEESQRILDRERARKAAANQPQPTPAPVAGQSAPALHASLTAAPPEKPRRKLGLIVGVSVVGVVVVGALAVGLGVGLSSGSTHAISKATFDTIRATP